MATQAPAEASLTTSPTSAVPIRPGRNADFLSSLNPDLSLVETYLGGESVYVEK